MHTLIIPAAEAMPQTLALNFGCHVFVALERNPCPSAEAHHAVAAFYRQGCDPRGCRIVYRNPFGEWDELLKSFIEGQESVAAVRPLGERKLGRALGRLDELCAADARQLRRVGRQFLRDSLRSARRGEATVEREGKGFSVTYKKPLAISMEIE